MELQELYLKTVFSCMACDGDIAPEEVNLVKKLASETDLFSGLDVEGMINNYVSAINQNGRAFLKTYLNDIAEAELKDDEQMNIVDLAFKTIMADNVIEYAEVKFFKKIRMRLSLSDETILAKFPDKEDFLLPDINVAEDPEWDDIQFAAISFEKEQPHSV